MTRRAEDQEQLHRQSHELIGELSGTHEKEMQEKDAEIKGVQHMISPRKGDMLTLQGKLRAAEAMMSEMTETTRKKQGDLHQEKGTNAQLTARLAGCEALLHTNEK